MQCILAIANAPTMAVHALGFLLLFSFVTALLGLPTTAPEEHTLSTDLQPPPLEETEHHGVIFFINLYAVKNISDASEEMFENDIVEKVPELLEPLATVLLVIEDVEDKDYEEHKPANLDEFAVELENQGFKVDKIDQNSETKVLKMKLEKSKIHDVIESTSKSSDEKKPRMKRTACLKCLGGYKRGYGGGYPSSGGGGYYPGGGGGGYYPPSGGGGGGGYYPPSGGGGGGYCPTCGGQGYQTAVVPVVVVPITGHHHHHHGGGYPRGGYYPRGGGGGCYGGCGGGGGGGSFSQASASAQASSGSWGKK